MFKLAFNSKYFAIFDRTVTFSFLNGEKFMVQNKCVFSINSYIAADQICFYGFFITSGK